MKKECSYCFISFNAPKNKSKYCSRSCARKFSRSIRDVGKRVKKNCIECGNLFLVVLSKKHVKFCSNKCYVNSRFGDESKRRARTAIVIAQILNSKKYASYIKGKAKSFEIITGANKEDILQDFFIELLEGRNTIIQKTALETAVKMYKQGLTGCPLKTLISNEPEEILMTEKAFDYLEYIEFCHDLSTEFKGVDFNITELIVHGFSINEIRRKIKVKSIINYSKKLKLLEIN